MKAPADRPELTATITAQALDQLIVIPCYASMPDRELEREAALIKKIALETGSDLTRGLERGEPMPTDAAEQSQEERSKPKEKTTPLAQDQAS